METGMYALKEDVRNPLADRRTTKWEQVPIFKKGKRFYFRAKVGSGVDFTPGSLSVLGNYGNIYPHDPRFKAMEPFLEPVEMTNIEWLRSNDFHEVYMEQTLARLLDMEKVTKGDLLGCKREIDADDERKEKQETETA